MKQLSVPEKHQLKIAKDTLKMSDVGAMIMGGMTKDEARDVIDRLLGHTSIAIADDGYADGGELYTDEELDYINERI